MAKTTKKETSEVLIGLWNCVDQAGLDKMIEEAFQLIPLKNQLDFIERLTTQRLSVDNEEERELWNELNAHAAELLKPRPLTEREYERNFYK